MAFEQYQHLSQHRFLYEDSDIKQEHFMPHMDPCQIYGSIPYPLYDELPTTFQEPHTNLNFDMIKSMHHTNTHLSACTSDIPSLHSTASAASIPSAASSTTGSPYSGHVQLVYNQTAVVEPGYAVPRVFDDAFAYGYDSHIDTDAYFNQEIKPHAPFLVDPSMMIDPHDQFTQYTTYPQDQHNMPYSTAASPAPSTHSYQSFARPMTTENFEIHTTRMRRQSTSSQRSGGSPRSISGDESHGKGKCPYDGCGKFFKDLKAHMTTHELERPEKCPIVSCEYHTKGFSRKYDRCRHTLTHYRGTMICGFCPGSGTAHERVFNRADVFKKHLTQVHGVEQAPPNSRKRTPSKGKVSLSSYCMDATGKCSICSTAFPNAQDFYEHLDDCVLKVVQQEDPIEAINAKALGQLANDSEVLAIFERNNLKHEEGLPTMDEDDEVDEDEEEDDETHTGARFGRGVVRTTKVTSNRPIVGGNISKRTAKKGLTWSKGGGSIIGKSRKRRKFYPPSWGMATDNMNMRKRVLCVYDGQRRLLKDEMMMHNEFEVRMPIADTNHYVTDLDMETIKRANAFHNATEEEKGPWLSDDFTRDGWS